MFCLITHIMIFQFLSRNILAYTKVKSHFSRTLATNNAKGFETAFAVEKLNKRGLLKLSGKDVFDFLQGVITNDIRHLDNSPSVYALFLNTKGRVMCDSIIYKTKEQNVLLVECDVASLSLLQKHMKLYRVRKKVDINMVDDQLEVWVCFRTVLGELDKYLSTKSVTAPEALHWTKSLNTTAAISEICDHIKRKDFLISRDPRLAALGYRIIAPVNEDVASIISETCSSTLSHNTVISYRSFRYLLGIGEGVDDLPPGSSFPLEANCDYLHGVSFHKGCYIGQELTARTYHTGVIRKRLMPFIFHSEPAVDIPPDTPIHTDVTLKKSAGKLRSVHGCIGLGLLRTAEALASSRLNILDYTGETYRPLWWPQEAPKERTAVIRES